VTTADLPALRNLKRCLPVFERITRGADDRLRLVVNRHHPKDAITVEDVQRALGLPVSWTLSNDYPSVIRSLNEGRPLSLDGRSGYIRDLQSASRELAGPEATGPGRSRLLAPLRQALNRFGRKPPEMLPVPRNHPGIATNNG
jgi:pilus assembly protein CpaE